MQNQNQRKKKSVFKDAFKKFVLFVDKKSYKLVN